MTRNELTKLWTKITSLFARKTDLNNKQDVINDLNDIRNGAALGTTALLSYIETDPTVPSWAKLSSKPSYTYSEISGTPTLANVATSGSYNDLIGTPDIPDEIKVGPVKGRMHRTNVSGSGNITITSASGIGFPNAPVTGNTFTYDVAIYVRSTTPGTAYSLTVNFGNTSYTLAAVNGVISDVRSITTDDDSLWTGSISSGSVGANSEIIVVIYQNVGPVVKTVGPAAITNNYADLNGLPTIPSAPGTLNTNNTTAQTASSSEALSGTIKLHKVSKTGSYNDLIDKPTIPTVNNATLTIQKNGTTVNTFTANASSAVTANITVPTATSDLTNDSGFVTGSKMYIGTCTTAAATNPKDCTVETFPLNNGEPYDGTVVCVKFTATDTSTTTTPTINVNNTGAKKIWYNNALLVTAKSTLQHGYANRYIYYVYDSSLDSGNGAWVWLGCGYDSNTTYSNATLGQGYAADTRTSAVAAVTATISSYALTVGGVVSIHFAYDVPANATLNIRSRGAKAIYYKNAPITAGVIKAGDTATFIYTTYYHLISIDRSEGADMTNYYTKTEVDTALSGKQATLVSGTNLKTVNSTSLLGSGNVTVQPTLVSGTNIKTINNESLLGSGNIDIQGGGSSMSITYDANTQALVIGGGSMNTYTITFSDNAYIVDMEINGQSTQYAFGPVEINEGDSFYCRVINTGNSGNTVVMGGVDITSSALTLITKDDGPITEYECRISIPSVTGDVSIIVSSNDSYNPYN